MSSSEEQNQKQGQVQVEIEDGISQGVYSNLALVSLNETEFVLDFIYLQPQQPKAKVRARIITSPVHTKKLLQVLASSIQKYEQKFGEIKIVPESERKIGFGNA